MEGENTAHQTMLCIDTLNKKAYLLDPNGSSTYFDDKIPKKDHHLFEPIIESMLCYYFKEISKLGDNITFINRSKWNLTKINVNISVDTISSTGNCVVTSLMIAHYMNVAHCEPYDGFFMISKIEKTKMCRCIDGYTKFLSDMVII